MEAHDRSSLLARIVRRVGQTVPAYLVLALGLLISFAAWRFTEQRVVGKHFHYLLRVVLPVRCHMHVSTRLDARHE